MKAGRKGNLNVATEVRDNQFIGIDELDFFLYVLITLINSWFF